MSTLAEHIIVAGAENRPLMLKKSMYDSLASRIRLFIKWKKREHIIVAGAENRPLMLKKSMYDSWASRIRLFIKWKKREHRLILEIKQPFKMVESQFNKFKEDNVRVYKKLRNCYYFKLKCCSWSTKSSEAQEAGQILDEEQLAFLVDPGLSEAPVAQQIIPQNLSFQTNDMDAYESNCDDLSSAKSVLICDLEVLFEDTNPSAPKDLLVLSLVEQMIDHIAHVDKENQTNKMVNESLITKLERYKERITIFEQRLNVDLNQREKLIDSQMDDLIHDRNTKLAAFQ
nr:hypothetical protein [Tanacetum cinerariifolium]